MPSGFERVGLLVLQIRVARADAEGIGEVHVGVQVLRARPLDAQRVVRDPGDVGVLLVAQVQGRKDPDVVVVHLLVLGQLIEVEALVLHPQTAQQRELADRLLIGHVGGVHHLIVVEQVGEERIEHRTLDVRADLGGVVERGVGVAQIVAGLQLALVGHRPRVVDLELMHVRPRLAELVLVVGRRRRRSGHQVVGRLVDTQLGQAVVVEQHQGVVLARQLPPPDKLLARHPLGNNQ